MPESCHCGEPVTFGYDGDPTHHRGMCARCDAVRCDVWPGECAPLTPVRFIPAPPDSTDW